MNALPIATTTLASRNAFQALECPLSENTPMDSGWFSETMPLPSRVVSRGIWKRSMKRLTSGPAPLRIAPKPTRATIGLSLRSASARVEAIASTRPGSGGTCFTSSWMS